MEKQQERTKRGTQNKWCKKKVNRVELNSHIAIFKLNTHRLNAPNKTQTLLNWIKYQNTNTWYFNKQVNKVIRTNAKEWKNIVIRKYKPKRCGNYIIIKVDFKTSSITKDTV